MPNETDFLKKAKKSKKDEFYTQLTDIEKELRHYKEFLKEKVVLCNCADPEEIGIKHLTDDGDFRSKECIDLLKESDVVVTNPPFSLFRDYIKQLIQYDKKFLIIGHQNAISYKEIFKLILIMKITLQMKIIERG